MKKILVNTTLSIMSFIVIVLMSVLTQAQSLNLTLLQNFKSIQPQMLAQNAKNIVSEIEKFSEIESLNTNDLELTVYALKTLVLIDSLDRSRSAVQMLASSYSKNKGIYQYALKKLSESEKKIVIEYYQMLERLNSSGQG